MQPLCIDQKQELRHLLIEFVDGPARTNLIQLNAGEETLLATGTQYEMGEKADELIAKWNTEGFRTKNPDSPPVFEPLQAAVALALKLGNTKIYTASENMTGEVALTAWPGLPPTNGLPYEYAVDC